MNSQQTIEPDLEFIARLEKAGGESLKKCYQCATCSVACELSPEDRPFPRKEMIWASWGLKDRLIADPDVWLCHQCNDCSKRCPRGARPGDVLAAVRSYVYENNAVPKFMGRLLARPSGLPALFLIPIIVLLVLHVVGHAEGFSFISGPVVYGNFLMHGWLEGLFITGNVLIFLIAGLGLYRFYRTLSGLSADGFRAQSAGDRGRGAYASPV